MAYKKAAMFGLDARIALAIFGALSVISGAALYSAIKTARLEQWRQYFVELNKASDAYYLDTGQELPLANTTYHYTHLSDLVENRETLSTWQGPYFATTKSGFGTHAVQDLMSKKIHADTHVRMYLKQTSTWAKMDALLDEVCAAGNADCAEWIDVYAHDASATATLLQLFNDLDEYVDNGDGALAGNIRYNEYGPDSLMVKGRSRKL
tara:strand:- start:1736 stop:2359 length:624 start_codon:yes stop_codon:yes gene_type:complete